MSTTTHTYCPQCGSRLISTTCVCNWTPPADQISRKLAIEICEKVRDQAKALGIPQMAIGATKCIEDLRTAPAPTPKPTHMFRARCSFTGAILDEGQGSEADLRAFTALHSDYASGFIESQRIGAVKE